MTTSLLNLHHANSVQVQRLRRPRSARWGNSAMTVISPDPTCFRRTAPTHGHTPLVVRDFPVLPKPGQALGLTWWIPLPDRRRAPDLLPGLAVDV